MEDIKWIHLEAVLNEFADEVIAKARENLDNNGSNATGQLSLSMDENADQRVKIEDGRFQVFLALADYFKYVEYGTGPSHVTEGVDEFNVLHLGVQHGKEPRAQYWAPIGVIKEWVANKPGVPKDDAFAYAVQGKIHAFAPLFLQILQEPAIEFVMPRYEELIDQAIQDDVEEYIEGVLNNEGLNL